MKRLAIETITKPMKMRGIAKGIAELDGQRLEIDLDNIQLEDMEIDLNMDIDIDLNMDFEIDVDLDGLDLTLLQELEA